MGSSSNLPIIKGLCTGEPSLSGELPGMLQLSASAHSLAFSIISRELAAHPFILWTLRLGSHAQVNYSLKCFYFWPSSAHDNGCPILSLKLNAATLDPVPPVESASPFPRQVFPPLFTACLGWACDSHTVRGQCVLWALGSQWERRSSMSVEQLQLC